MAMTSQMLMRGLDGRTSCLRFPSRTIAGSLLQEHIATILRIPAEVLLIVTGARVVNTHTFLCASSDGLFPSCSLLLRLRGGKGGFGSLLRGAATKAGQKKTSNFDACRDMSGRRLRHVNAEKKLKEWKAQAKERELEKTANEFLKKQVKQKEDESGCSQVIERFREETFRAREDVESAVARGLAEAKKLGKRKTVDDSLPSTSSKRSHIWFSSEIDMIEEDSEDEREGSEDEDVDSEEGNEDEGAEEGSQDEDMEKGSEDENRKEGSEDDKAKQGSEVEKVEERFVDEKAKGSSECEKDEERVEEKNGCNGLDNGKGSEDENLKEGSEDDKAKQGSEVEKVEERFVDEKAKVMSEDVKAQGSSECEKDEERVEEKNGCNGLDNGNAEKNIPMVDVVEGDGYHTSSTSVSLDVDLQKHQSPREVKMELGTNAVPTCGENTCNENGFRSKATNTSFVTVETMDLLVQSKLNLDDYLHPSELEVLGLERLKQELQVRGLKCGGSLAERAGRLFLLKTIPLEKLEKKHFAKARA